MCVGKGGGVCGGGGDYPTYHYTARDLGWDPTKYVLRMYKGRLNFTFALYRIIAYFVGQTPQPHHGLGHLESSRKFARANGGGPKGWGGWWGGASDYNSHNGMWQGWLTNKTDRDEIKARIVMTTLCHSDKFKALAEYFKGPLTHACHCLDRAKQTELTELDPLLKVECHSPECRRGRRSTYMFTPRGGCAPVTICSQKLNVNGETVSLNNVRLDLNCPGLPTKKPNNTGSVDEWIGTEGTEEPKATEITPEETRLEPKRNLAPIIGGVVGGVVVLLMILVIVIAVVKRRKRARK